MTYVVAELGQNMQGSVRMAESMIDICANPRPHDLRGGERVSVDAVKLTMRDLEHEGSREFMAQTYEGRNSFGDTYGEHRAELELSEVEHACLHDYARAYGLDVVETLCHPNCLSLLDWSVPDALKVASRDLTNLPLIEALAETGLPLILSTGMADRRDIERALQVVTKHHDDVTVMHCLSQYPAEWDHLQLRAIQTLGRWYPRYRIGYSDHTPGIMAPVAAVALGAEVIEKHVTLDRTLRGSDHMGALSRDGLWRMLRDLRHLERALGTGKVRREDVVEAASRKLERSLAASRKIREGERITEEDLELLSPGTGLRWDERGDVVGDVAAHDIEPQTIMSSTMALEA